jgi:hypothetical protein
MDLRQCCQGTGIFVAKKQKMGNIKIYAAEKN